MKGKPVADEIYKKIKLANQPAKKIKLVIVLIGNNPASLVYIKQKIKACDNLGFEHELIHLENEKDYNTEQVLEMIEQYNSDKNVTGIIIQMPIAAHLDKNLIINAVAPEKDVDGLHPLNIGKTFLGPEFEELTPCTANGVIKMLEFYKIEIVGKNITVIGTGNIAGKPIAMMLSNRKATVTMCNSSTKDLKLFTKNADIIVSAAGALHLVNSEMIKKDAVIIDVGINHDQNGDLAGDVDFENVSKKTTAISPVPGGVGKMTVACLMYNLAKAGGIEV